MNFMKSNALLSGREKSGTSAVDLEIYKIVHPYLVSSSRVYDETGFLSSMLESGLSEKAIRKKLKWGKTKYFKIKGLLDKQRQGVDKHGKRNKAIKDSYT